MADHHAHARLRAVLERSDLDALVAISPENVFYLTGALISTQRWVPDRLAIVVWPRAGEPTMIICTIEDTLTRQNSSIQDIRGYTEFVTPPVHLLTDVLAEKGLSGGRIGYERAVWRIGEYEEWVRRAPNATLVPADHQFDLARMIKSDWEIEKLGSAARATDAAIHAAFSAARLGWSEKAIADMIQTEMLAAGADNSPFLVLSAGDNTQRVHHYPNTNPIPVGAIVHFDGGGSWQGYYSDMARTAVVGEATAEQRENYARICRVQADTIDALRVGTRACDVFHACAAAFERHGLPFGMPHIGHSLGTVLHEYPILNPQTEQPLEAGMLFCIEPACVAPDGAFYHIEDLVAVTPGGPRILSRATDWRELPVIRP